MADFSASGIYQLPPLTVDNLRLGGDPRVLGWLQEAIQEGDATNRDDPAWDMADKGMRYIIGEQASSSRPHVAYIPHTILNKSRKSVQAHVSALTDIKPVFGYKATNPQFGFHSDLLNKLTVATWITNMMDITLGDTIKYALAGGTGDLCVEWDPSAAYGQGDHQIIAKDFRDTLPIRPSTNPSPQFWQGVVFREAHSVNAMRSKYPRYDQAFRPAPDSLITTVMSRFRRGVARISSPASDTLSGLANVPQARPIRPGDIVLYRAFLNDHTRNLTAKPIVMGDPAANWSYVVEPGMPMYPQKRLLVATPELVLYDGPSPFWHGLYPFSRLRLWSVPWCFLGLSLLHDTIPVQDAINDSMTDLRLGIKQWINPDTVYDTNVASSTGSSRAFQQAFDPQRPGKKIKVNTMSGGQLREPYKKVDGPNPQVLSLLLETYRQLNTEHDELTGVANLQNLMQLRQMPGADTIQKYYEALTPELRQEGRNVEAFLRDVAEMHKFNIFQYCTSARRVNILGDAGLALEDFDFDPDSLVPAMDAQEMQPDPATGIPVPMPTKGYLPELDRSKSRSDRAKAFAKMFIFTIAPNSILAMNAQEKKMMNFQLARMGYLDFWTLHESLETPNIGNPPPMPLPPLQEPDPQEVMASIIGQIEAATTGMPPAQPAKYILDPATGQIMEMRTPTTVTERLMAQQMMGIGMTTNPAGRKASGESAPQQEEKSDGEGGQRTTITESDK
jgi:hypothetical protein